MNYGEAFAAFEAVPTNVNWSCSAWTPKGELVLSIWQPLFHKGPAPKTMEVTDSMSHYDWAGPGPIEFHRHMTQAWEQGAPIRAIIIVPKYGTDLSISQRGNATDITPRPDIIGELQAWDGDFYQILFKQVQ